MTNQSEFIRYCKENDLDPSQEDSLQAYIAYDQEMQLYWEWEREKIIYQLNQSIHE